MISESSKLYNAGPLSTGRSDLVLLREHRI
jgi:hypothetical protein